MTERKYEGFMQQRLFGLLGMKSTTFWPSTKQMRRIAKSYRPDFKELISITPPLVKVDFV